MPPTEPIIDDFTTLPYRVMVSGSVVAAFDELELAAKVVALMINEHVSSGVQVSLHHQLEGKI